MPTLRLGNTISQPESPGSFIDQIVYDREERSRLAIEQGKFTEEHFIKPYQNILAQWSASNTL
ncbi:Domain of uncharacterised function (DUF1852) [Raoultella terrigena]|uniref:Domain of uncharacterized function (DUF1852) n=1 Tax=Raoultella terrigena TaxID=577 RepID=A0A3P8KMI3_RAOTE|nr:Domain of uncharacterised function (DUF1852) [Raoultella terrigena]